MKARLIQAWGTLRESYWFLPAICSLLAVALAVAAIVVDRTWGPWSYEVIPVIRPDGARAVLSTAAGSLITVAGVAISVTLVALASMSSQFGPRLLVLFLRDRGIQLALALFAASFLYCLVILLFVRSAGEQGSPFVPQLGLALAFVASVVSVATFIYLVHHVAQMLQVGNVVARAGTELIAATEALERRRGRGSPVEDDDLSRLGPPKGASVDVLADRNGYLQVMDLETLVEVAGRLGRLVAVQQRVGEFVTEGMVIARIWPAEALSPDDEAAIRRGFAWGSRRTHEQDVRYQADQVVQIAARALSPGVNDPFTATNCIDWLEAAVRRFGYLTPARWLRHEAGDAGVLLHPVTTYHEFVDGAMGQLTPYAAADPIAARHLATALRRQRDLSDAPAHRAHLDATMDRLRDAVSIHLANRADAARVLSLLDGEASAEP